MRQRLSPFPAAYQAKVAAEVPTREFKLDVFSRAERLPMYSGSRTGSICSLAYQDHKAPLLFLIAGTGSRHNSSTMVKLQRTFHQAGFHVISISSPTHMNFVVNASTGMPGNTVRTPRTSTGSWNWPRPMSVGGGDLLVCPDRVQPRRDRVRLSRQAGR